MIEIIHLKKVKLASLSGWKVFVCVLWMAQLDESASDSWSWTFFASASRRTIVIVMIQ